tara:strand:- start:4135 stop:5166 length:1032 start_codon:yes stop_codon:yes gene_type:complete
MAKKAVHQNYDADALKFFGLETDPQYGLVSSSQSIDKVLCTQDETTYNKIHSILTVPTEDGNTFRTKKKAFVLPRCNVSNDRIKAALKEHSITVTNDYEKADLIVSHEEITTHRLENGDNIPTTVMMNKIWNYETTLGDDNSVGLLKTIADSGVECILTPKITDVVSYYKIDTEMSLYDNWIISALAINLAHVIDTTGLAVVSVDDILRSSATRIDLTEEVLKDLIAQVNSYESKSLALKIVPTINYNKNYHLLWQLAQDCSEIEYGDTRDKDLKYWVKSSNFVNFSRKSAQDMILWLEEQELLNKESFKYLEPIVRREISIQNRDLYTFKVAVKKEYQQYLK